MKNFIALMLMISFSLHAQTPNQDRMRARMQSEVGDFSLIEKECRLELVAKSSPTEERYEGILETEDACMSRARKSLKEAQPDFTKVLMRYGTGKWKVVERK